MTGGMIWFGAEKIGITKKLSYHITNHSQRKIHPTAVFFQIYDEYD